MPITAVYSIHHYKIKFVSDLWQVCGFSLVSFTNKTACQYVESGIKHHNLNPHMFLSFSISKYTFHIWQQNIWRHNCSLLSIFPFIFHDHIIAVFSLNYFAKYHSLVASHWQTCHNVVPSTPHHDHIAVFSLNYFVKYCGLSLRSENFRVWFLCTYSKIFQSEQSIYLIQCSDWLFFEQENKLMLKKIMILRPDIKDTAENKTSKSISTSK